MPSGAPHRLELLLEALAAERDPPTGVRDPSEALDRHIADSLSALEVAGVREATAGADVGAGAGFPGLPLAVALPAARFDLIEATRRKCEVIDRLALAAGIGNARAVPKRAEEWAAGTGREAYGLVVARALASLAVVAEYAAPLLVRGGLLVAWKGVRDPAEEEAGAGAAAALGLEPREVRPVEPFAGARNRHLHVYVKTAPTPERFPRRPGVARKRPLR